MTTFSKTHGAIFALTALIGFVTFSQGCSAAHGNSETPGTLICGSFASVDSAGKPTQEPEYFRVAAMNAKLAYFPEFAAAAGVKQVTDCASARRVYLAYARFANEHPGFDNNQPQPPVPHLNNLPGHRPASPLTSGTNVPKIYNGIQTVPPLVPVVELSYDIPEGTPYFDASGLIDSGTTLCTGTFIAKNWILTAAHCIGPIALQTQEGAQSWLTTYDWTIAFPDEIGQTLAPSDGGFTNTTAGQRGLHTRATSIVDGSYLGVTSTSLASKRDTGDATTTNHDVALLYLPPEDNDGKLPPEVMLGQTALAISTVAFNPGTTTTAYGYGPNPNGLQPVNLNATGTARYLTSAPLGIPNVLSTNGSVITEEIVTAGFSYASLCDGDSGGPLVADFGTDTQPALTIVGVASRGAIDALDGVCASTIGDLVEWVDVSSELSFIEGSLQSQYGDAFACKRFPENANPNTYMECWTTQCTSSCDCDSKSFCNNPTLLDPSSAFQNGESCTSCDDGTCDCIVGECLPRPNFFDASDPVLDGGCITIASGDDDSGTP